MVRAEAEERVFGQMLATAAAGDSSGGLTADELDLERASLVHR
ncbi:hypothetical protein [Kribbella flavida]|nr:hypothetical protein [Kribbella flavida]